MQKKTIADKKAASSPAKTAARKPKKTPTSSASIVAPATPLCIAAIGASAGGFEAITEFLRVMPADSGIGFIIVQHFDPSSKSMAAELFARRTAMPVSEAVDNTPLVANHIYTIPADREAAIVEGHIRLTPIAVRPSGAGPRLPIDHLFHTLGNDQQEKAIGIIFSGTGCDGTLGLKTIEANGGIVLAQQPETAQYDGMPRSAIATGLVDYVLPIEKMPAMLIGYARHPYLNRGADATADGDADTDHSPSLETIFTLIHQQCGYNFVGYKQKTLLRRIHRRMGLRHIESIDAYIVFLRANPLEITALFKDLLIGVTDFFRDGEAWQTLLHDAIQPLVASKTIDEPIRVWVAGTSTGEEAYSIAILLLEQVSAAGKRCPINVFATDTNADALATARTGLYPSSIVAQIAPQHLQRYFKHNAETDQYQVSPQLRGVVVFGLQNIFSDPPFSRVDLVSCRNLLIYLEPEAQKKAILLFHFALRPNGYLFLGGAETIGPRDDLFNTLSKKWRIYQRIGSTPHKQLNMRFAPSNIKLSASSALDTRAPQPANRIAALAQQLILEHFAPASVLVNSKYEVVYFCGPTERFLTLPKGTPTQDLIALTREGLRSRLRGALRQAVLSDSSVIVGDARVRRNNGYVAVKLTVTPAGATNEHGHLLLVVFEDEYKAATSQTAGSDELTLLKHLEDELQVTKDDLQNSIERLETSNEELKISNEEVVSVNEELQSINEELESSKEELQSLNEELNTVNQQLESKVSELEVANNDLKNLISSSDIATLCLDRELRIKWFTPALRALFSVVPTDIGRPISDISSTVPGELLMAEAKAVLQQLAARQTELKSTDDHWYIQRVLPYRTDHQSVDGIIVTFADITDSKQAAAAVIADREKLLASLEQRVEQRTAELRSLAFELTKSEERERRGVALDLHDGLGQLLAIAKIKLSNLQNENDTAQIVKTLAEVEKLVDQSNQSVRSLAAQLSPAVLYDLGLVPALEWLADEMQQSHGLICRISEDREPKPLDPAVRAILFRAVREILINVVKHADVHTVRVTIAIAAQPVAANTQPTTISIVVVDNGKGFDPQLVTQSPHSGFGLLNIRERLAYIGGSADIVSAPGSGTRVTLTAPLQIHQTH